jgi:hypothetical protein
MKAKFIGDPNDDGSGPKVCRLGHGPTGAPSYAYFPRDRFVGVPPALESAIAGNNHFATEEGDAEPYVPDEAATHRDPLDHDRNGRKGGRLGKTEAIARLTALKVEHPDLEFDEKWNAKKLQATLEEAEFEYGDE